MANLKRHFVAGRMNKMVDERLVPNGEYIDALNIRMGSTEDSEVGVVENTKGNSKLSSLQYITGQPLSIQAVTIGAYADSARETIYWLVHDPAFIPNANPDTTLGPTGKLDLIVSYNAFTTVLMYHVVSINDGGGVNTTLNFDPQHLITGINLVDDLLFFTDFNNQPRKINVKASYSLPAGNIDQITEEELMVLRKPPIHAPDITLLNTDTDSNFLEERFICFAYRYKYSDGEYSATSQFSEPAFMPRTFEFNMEAYLNVGMKNFVNTALVKYNSGGPLVVGVDLLFKEADSNVIKIIEKIDKKQLGLNDDTEYDYTFTGSKIFTVLPDSEILRLYDNVPRRAKAQTIMGNRLVYGNYVEGYDLVDANGWPLLLEYTTELISEDIGDTTLPNTTTTGTYTIDDGLFIPNSVVNIDLTGVELREGVALSINIRFAHFLFSGDTYPTEQTTNTEVVFDYLLQRDYDSVYEFASSPEFLKAVGTAGANGNIKTVQESCTGGTFTDEFNCVIPNSLSDYIKYKSGITADDQAIGVITSPTSNIVGLQLPAMHFQNTTVTPTQDVYEYYEVSFVEAFYQTESNTQSLHSNRGYEVGIVYMDEFLRGSTALVSRNNTIHVPCDACDSKNQIRVTIPTSQIPPYWAKYYKLVIKPDKEQYETIYTNIFFRDDATNSTYFLLEGENASKIEAGDRLYVKADTNGAIDRCVVCTVLEKEAKEEGFLELKSEVDPTSNLFVPHGTYMKINANNFATQKDELSVIDYGTFEDYTDADNHCPVIVYPVWLDKGDGTWMEYSIPAGSQIKFTFEMKRKGVGAGNGKCERRIYTLEKAFVASRNYDDFELWFRGDNIQDSLNDGVQEVGGDGADIENVFIETMLTDLDSYSCNVNENYWQFYQDSSTGGGKYLVVTGTVACEGEEVFYRKSRRSSIRGQIVVIRADALLIFETEPSHAIPDIFYENEQSFEIVNGNHMGNFQDQDITLGKAAIIDTSFFNCYAFGNGAESFKVQDSIKGKPFSLGNRTSATAEQEYKEAHRFADITWSGVYNDETNLNKLNSFNLGLLNFKPLEDSFGDIQILDGRMTDVLVLQEDKISYVLAGKNLLSDAAAGGTITSIPEVFGIQIARVEKYGISHNPESYVCWGEDRFFTDAKRGAVINIKGNSFQGDGLKAISNLWMESWFRDLFNDDLKTQKLGGFDPYMSEYVLSSNNKEVYFEPDLIPCGAKMGLTLEEGEVLTYFFNLGNKVGPVTINYTIVTIEDKMNIVANYNGVEYSDMGVSSSGTITFNKDKVYEDQVQITLQTVTGAASVEVVVDCPIGTQLTVIEVCLTDYEDRDLYVHNEYRYKGNDFTSPLQSTLVMFSSQKTVPIISQYESHTGYKGEGAFPTDGSKVRIISHKFGFDTFDFDKTYNKLRFLSTDTHYGNNSSELLDLLAAAHDATPIYDVGSGMFYSEFDAVSSHDYLYLIWDYRKPVAKTLCYSASNDLDDICCHCDEDRMDIGVVINDVITFSDNASGGLVWEQPLADSITITDDITTELNP